MVTIKVKNQICANPVFFYHFEFIWFMPVCCWIEARMHRSLGYELPYSFNIWKSLVPDWRRIAERNEHPFAEPCPRWRPERWVSVIIGELMCEPSPTGWKHFDTINQIKRFIRWSSRIFAQPQRRLLLNQHQSLRHNTPNNSNCCQWPLRLQMSYALHSSCIEARFRR